MRPSLPDASPTASFISHALDEAGYVHHSSTHRPVPDLLRAVVGSDAHDVEAAVKRFQFRLGVNSRSDPARRAVFDVDGDAHRNFSLVAKRLQRVEGGDFHQPNHVWRRIHGWQLGVISGKRVLQLDGFSRLSTHADGDGSGHAA
jgi:hypothetical protein